EILLTERSTVSFPQAQVAGAARAEIYGERVLKPRSVLRIFRQRALFDLRCPLRHCCVTHYAHLLADELAFVRTGFTAQTHAGSVLAAAVKGIPESPKPVARARNLSPRPRLQRNPHPTNAPWYTERECCDRRTEGCESVRASSCGAGSRPPSYAGTRGGRVALRSPWPRVSESPSIRRAP